MQMQPYELDELEFAYCSHVYYRWHTHWRKAQPGLARITPCQIQAERPDVHILELESSESELALLASLRPSDSVSSAASKLKGGTSKIVRQMDKIDSREKILGEGYFACTTGPRTSEELNRYLDQQGQHHGYNKRANPPVYVRTWPAPNLHDLQANRSRTVVRWHFVFSTWDRKGTFTAEAAEATLDRWEDLLSRVRFRFLKASFVPDHIHLAIQTHPAVVPAQLVPEFLNSSQDLMLEQFDDLIIRTGYPRVWKPSAYIGTVGDLANGQIQAYLRNWGRREGRDS